ncbi:MAG: hypothetical protein WCK63_12010 [Betaproteobacteria bacterium]
MADKETIMVGNTTAETATLKADRERSKAAVKVRREVMLRLHVRVRGLEIIRVACKAVARGHRGMVMLPHHHARVKDQAETQVDNKAVRERSKVVAKVRKVALVHPRHVQGRGLAIIRAARKAVARGHKGMVMLPHHHAQANNRGATPIDRAVQVHYHQSSASISDRQDRNRASRVGYSPAI